MCATAFHSDLLADTGIEVNRHGQIHAVASEHLLRRRCDSMFGGGY